MDLEQIVALVPGIPPNAGDRFVVSSDGTLTGSARKILRYLVRLAVPDVPPALVAGLGTLGDVRVLLDARATDGSTQLPALSDAATSGVFMRPVMPSDHEQLYFAALEPANAFRWRFRGRTVSFREFSETLAAGSLVQFAFAATGDGALVAFCSAYGYDPNARHSTFAVQRLDFDERHDTVVVESVALFLNHLFRTFDLRKVFAEVPEYNFEAFGLVERVFRTEGEKLDYHWHAGRHWSEITISTDRDAWLRFAEGFFA